MQKVKSKTWKSKWKRFRIEFNSKPNIKMGFIFSIYWAQFKSLFTTQYLKSFQPRPLNNRSFDPADTVSPIPMTRKSLFMGPFVSSPGWFSIWPWEADKNTWYRKKGPVSKILLSQWVKSTLVTGIVDKISNFWTYFAVTRWLKLKARFLYS